MPLLPGVTRAFAADEPRRRRCALVSLIALIASGLPGPTSAQTQPPNAAVEAPRQEPSTGAAPSAASLARIRHALALRQATESPRLEGLNIVGDGSLGDRRSAVQLLPGLDFVGGLDLFGVIDETGRQLGPPTHRDMMSFMTSRDMNEAVSSDVLGIASVTAISLGLPYAIKAVGAIGGWLFGHEDDDAPEQPLLTERENTRARGER